MQTHNPAPGEFSGVSRFILVSAAFVIVVAGMRAAEAILVPFLLSLFIAVVCSPLLLWLKKRGLPNGLAIVSIIFLIIAIGGAISAVVGSSVAEFRQDIPVYQERLTSMFQGLIAKLQGYGLDLETSVLAENIDPGAALRIAGNTLASFGSLMTEAFLILLTVIFIMAEEVGFSEKLKSAKKNFGVGAIARFTESVNHYMAIKMWISLLTAVLVFVWLLILGVDYPVMWSLLAFLLNFVPSLGSILAAIPAVLLALVQLGPVSALLTGAGYLVVNTVVGNGIEPRVMGRGLNLSALVVFLSLVFWGWVLGPVGMLLSVPLTMTVKIALESNEDTHWIGVLLGSGEAAEAPDSIDLLEPLEDQKEKSES
ncbi:AI-2E family transporter [uncultured Pseudoteredinibacter sp.]|uniref:AI-2E family transporter n=1 Tax=uncultured Pseudoteredinibacter sp. TaxID=1641701 RepID=UPI002603DE74|nr:AI-2E family transporter [uncultured Pseudoteredinibacter sp.]